MLKLPKTPYRVPFDDSFRVKHAKSKPASGSPDKEACAHQLATHVEELSELQKKLYAENTYSLLIVFQAIDAAGKDGTIRAVMTGINPAGCQVFSFKQPSTEELHHDFLWRVSRALPEGGRIGIFNRSHYEEVLAVRVHPEFLARQRIPGVRKPSPKLWQERLQSIADFEHHLARNGTIILKFWLNVSKAEQRKRLLERIDDPKANWKFEAGDVDERDHWDEYMAAYEDTLRATSRPWAPWYAIPADDKPFMRVQVAKTIVHALRKLDLDFPKLGAREVAALKKMRTRLAKS